MNNKEFEILKALHEAGYKGVHQDQFPESVISLFPRSAYIGQRGDFHAVINGMLSKGHVIDRGITYLITTPGINAYMAEKRCQPWYYQRCTWPYVCKDH